MNEEEATKRVKDIYSITLKHQTPPHRVIEITLSLCRDGLYRNKEKELIDSALIGEHCTPSPYGDESSAVFELALRVSGLVLNRYEISAGGLRANDGVLSLERIQKPAKDSDMDIDEWILKDLLESHE